MAGRGILRAAQELKADLVVVGLDPNRGVAIEPIGPATELLLRRANFEVIWTMSQTRLSKWIP